MPDVSSGAWKEHVARYADLSREWDEASAAYDQLEPRDSGDTEEERRLDSARDRAYAEEARLLEMTPPDMSAARDQLKLFAMHFHGVDLDEELAPGIDEPEGAILRRIYRAFAAVS